MLLLVLNFVSISTVSFEKHFIDNRN